MLSNIDALLTHWMNSPVGFHPFLDNLMIGVTYVTIPLMVLAVAVRWWSRLQRERERCLAIEAGLTFVVGMLINQLIVLFLSRVRPYDAGVTHLIVVPSSDSSFPSDHATGAIAIVAATWLNDHSRRAMLFAVPAGLLVFSRVYVGTHFVSDVIGGAGTAVAAAIAVRGTKRIRAPYSAVITRFL